MNSFVKNKLFLILIVFAVAFTGIHAKKADKPIKEKEFALNFNNVELADFLNMMSQLTGKNIIIDDKIKGKISISSSKKVPVSQALEIMKSILEVKGLAVIESGNIIKVIPVKEAIKKNVEIIIDGEKKNISLLEEKTVTFLLELTYADATEVLTALNPLKSQYTDIVVYKSLNILILSGTANEIEGLIKIAKALDKKIDLGPDQPEVAKGNIHVVHLENANAEQLADVLSRVPFSEKALINTAPYMKNIRASEKAGRVTNQQQQQQQQGQQQTGQPGQPKQKLSIIANKETNSLIIAANAEEIIEIKRIIKELDVVREQVLIEALIIEVSAENGWGFGIDWMLGNQTGQFMYGGSSINGGVPNYTSPTGLSGKKLPIPAATGMQLGFLLDASILSYALLNASGTDKNFNILSTPQILATDNQESEINVGEDIPIPTNNRISENGTQFFSFDYKPVGLKLKITPHITKKEKINLQLYLEVNSVLGTTTVLPGGNIIPPTLGKRDIKTNVTVMDGKTIVVGGLIRNDKQTSETGVPGIKDVPLLGWLFKRKSVTYKKSNLLVFITPHIVTKQEKIDSITEKKLNMQKRLKEKD